MKKLNTATAIILGAIIIAITILIIGNKDPLAECMEKVVKDGIRTVTAARVCSGKL